MRGGARSMSAGRAGFGFRGTAPAGVSFHRFSSNGVVIRTFPSPFFSRRFHHRFFRPYPYWGWGWGYGGYGYAADYAPVDAYSQPWGTSAPYQAYDNSYLYMQNQAISDQLNRLTDEVAQLRAEQQARANPAPERETAPPTVLVYRDRHREEVQNYAVVGQTLWVFDEQKAHKIPLAQLDISATTKANDERGIDFRVPK